MIRVWAEAARRPAPRRRARGVRLGSTSDGAPAARPRASATSTPTAVVLLAVVEAFGSLRPASPSRSTPPPTSSSRGSSAGVPSPRLTFTSSASRGGTDRASRRGGCVERARPLHRDRPGPARGAASRCWPGGRTSSTPRSKEAGPGALRRRLRRHRPETSCRRRSTRPPARSAASTPLVYTPAHRAAVAPRRHRRRHVAAGVRHERHRRGDRHRGRAAPPRRRRPAGPCTCRR